MVLYLPKRVKTKPISKRKLKRIKECYQKIMESNLMEHKFIPGVSFEYEDYRAWYTKLLDWIVDTLSMDIRDLFRRGNDEDY